MRALTATALLLALSAGALAKPNSVERPTPRACERGHEHRFGRSYARQHWLGRSYARAGLFWSAAIAVQRWRFPLPIGAGPVPQDAP